MRILKLLPRFRNMERELQRLEQRENWSAAEISAFQLERINRLWDVARRTIPYYAKLHEQEKLPDSFASLKDYVQQMPLLPKQMVRDTPDDFLSSEAAPGAWQRTGGSTGVPTAIYWEHTAHREMLRSKYRCEQAYGLDVFDKKVFLWGHSGSFAPGFQGLIQRTIRPFQDNLRNRLRVSAYDLSSETLRANLTRIQRFAPKSMYGYSSAMDLIAAEAEKNRIELPSLQLAVLTAEPADSRMLDRVRANLNCKAVIEYGSVECGILAYLIPDGTIRTRDDVVFVETVAMPDGSIEIVVTVLNNPSFPLMRYCIEDTTSRFRQQPERGFGILADVQGRNNDMLRSMSGRRLHSMAVKHTLEHWPQIRKFAARQDSEGNMKVILETPDPLSDKLVHSLQSKLESMMEGFSVEMEMVNEISGNLAGKHRWIISEYKPPTEGK